MEKCHLRMSETQGHAGNNLLVWVLKIEYLLNGAKPSPQLLTNSAEPPWLIPHLIHCVIPPPYLEIMKTSPFVPSFSLRPQKFHTCPAQCRSTVLWSQLKNFPKIWGFGNLVVLTSGTNIHYFLFPKWKAAEVQWPFQPWTWIKISKYHVCVIAIFFLLAGNWKLISFSKPDRADDSWNWNSYIIKLLSVQINVYALERTTVSF